MNKYITTTGYFLFGKHKGQHITTVSKNYLEWAHRKILDMPFGEQTQIRKFLHDNKQSDDRHDERDWDYQIDIGDFG